MIITNFGPHVSSIIVQLVVLALCCSDVNQFWTVTCLDVLQSYGGRGIAKRLVKFSLELAKQRGHTVVRANFASCYSRKLGYSCGFKPIPEVHFNEYGNYNNIPPNVRELHDKVEVMVRFI